MPYFVEWNDYLSVNVDEIDAHHKKLIEIINKLYQAMIDGTSESVMKSILVELIEYTKYHFSTEENIMEEYGYSQIDEHKEMHKAFVTNLADACSRYQVEKIPIDKEILDYLKDWLINHILKTDTYLGVFLNGKGKY